ncbi:centromere protein Scm3-domain-containing protein [Aspergillus leporis]|jgi:hypothetical protein|uniref:Centromere protein Scm3-domain-containing protein n=1 Tax=Aspergillus leporis TaxID=41062 RepID=A0A5N5WHX6_9EURO|nr:centromere protein Scm3-domain-containing protein [Aspergillus leporis]
MERRLKRPRLSFTTGPGDEDEPDNIDLQEARAQNDQRLKSIFEGIFEKYGKDFSDVGDEIDLRSGKIVVNNGHIQGLEDEDDTGEKGAWLFNTDESAATAHNISHYSEAGTSGDLLEDGDTYLQHTLAAAEVETRPGLDGSWESRKSEALIAQSDADDDGSSVDSLLDTALNVQNGPDDSVRQGSLIDTEEPVTKEAKTAAKTPAQSEDAHKDGFTEAVDSVWRVPKISGKLSTPSLSRSQPTVSFNVIRSASPPGAGSIWALPWTSRRNTDVMKKRSEKKGRTGGRKRKLQSSPIVYDWSFAQTPDGSESDDPLQENYQPSPTPKGTLNIRGKRLGSGTPSRTKNQSDDRKVCLPRADHISQHRQAFFNPAEGQHDTIEATKQSDATIDVASDTINNDAIFHDISSKVTDSPKVEPSWNQIQPQESTTPSKRARTFVTPDEARLIVVMRQVQRKNWKEITDRLPGKKPKQLIQWNALHWNERRANPPPLSKPWSSTERETLDKIKNQQGLTWHAVRTMLPGRSIAETEFELLRLWVGDDIWNSEHLSV